MLTTLTYKGYTVSNRTTQMEDGRYRAQAAVISLHGGRTRSQRFLDFETFRTEVEAEVRALAGAMAWIDQELRQDRLALPSSFAALAR